MIVNEETKANAQAVLDYIHAHPEKHSQSNWVGNKQGGGYFWRYFDSEITETNVVCGTTMCAAGTAIYLFEGVAGLNAVGNPPVGALYKSWSQAAGHYFGFENSEESDKLFFRMNEEQVVDMLSALANGDLDKFEAIVALDEES